MALSVEMHAWLIVRVAEAKAILSSPYSTQSQRAVARMVISQHGGKQ